MKGISISFRFFRCFIQMSWNWVSAHFALYFLHMWSDCLPLFIVQTVHCSYSLYDIIYLIIRFIKMVIYFVSVTNTHKHTHTPRFLIVTNAFIVRCAALRRAVPFNVSVPRPYALSAYIRLEWQLIAVLAKPAEVHIAFTIFVVKCMLKQNIHYAGVVLSASDSVLAKQKNIAKWHFDNA